MAIRQFLNLNKKEINNKFDEIVKKIAKAYSIGNKTYAKDKKNVVIPRISYIKAF